MLCGWARDGLIDEQIAAKCGVSPSTLYDWKRRFPEISEALKKGKEVVDIEVENALLRRATGYDAVETIEEVSDKNGRSVKRVTRLVPGDVTAQIFWLTNRRPDKWRRNVHADDSAAAVLRARALLEKVECDADGDAT